jgi:hypothetical protein
MLTYFVRLAVTLRAENATPSLGKEMATLGIAGPALIVAGNSAI